MLRLANGRPRLLARKISAFGPAILLSVALFGLFGGSCSGRPPQTPTEITDDGLPRPDARLIVATDLLGYLEPCGCQSRPLGGIDKLATTLAQLRAGGIPTAFVAAGDLFFDGLSHGGVSGSDANAQELWKSETLVGILNRLSLTAATPGATDLSMGAPQLAALAHSARFPLLASGVSIEGDPLHAGPVVRDIGALKVGFFGVSEFEGPDGTLPAGVTRAMDPTMAARTSVDQLRREGANVIVGLVRATRRLARRIANDVHGIDFLVTGGLNEEAPTIPAEAGRTTLIHAGRQGQRLVVVDLYRRGDGGYADVSAWTRRTERDTLTHSITELRARIAAWEQDSHANAADVQAQRTRLVEMEARAAQLSARPTPSGNYFAARAVELGPEVHGDAAVAAVVDAYDARVNDHNRVAFANVTPRPVAEGQPHYVGSEACTSCHAAAVRWWQSTPHGHAYATLERAHKQYNLSCVGCHVTGYNQPGGSTVTHNENLINVGCEQCHGPGSMHASDPVANAIARRDTPESICLQCHTHDHSDLFNYATYRTMLIAPGHGQPAPHASAESRTQERLLAWSNP